MDNTLAINGGKPISEHFIGYGKQYIDEDDIDKVVEVLKSDYLTTGPMVEKFEDKIKNYVDSKYAVAVSNGTAALHLACLAADIKAGDEVITTSMTFAASANAILYCGAKPVFADIDEENYNISPESIEKCITEKTKAIIAVDFTGQSCDFDKILKIARKNNLILIEDAAHSMGSKYKGKMIGSIADMTTFSFHPVKIITTGEGGMVTTNNKELYQKLYMLRTHGITRDENLLQDKTKGKWYYEQQTLGFNYRISDIQCALGISQFYKIDRFIKKRKEIEKIYNRNLSEIDEVLLQKEESYSDTARHLYVIKLDLEKLTVSRDVIYEALLHENIGVNLHYLPVYLHPYYKELGYKKGLCPNSEKLYESMISIPFHPSMSDIDIKNVIYGLKKVLRFYKKL